MLCNQGGEATLLSVAGYEVANATMASLREGAKNVPGYENLPQAGGVVAMSAANLVDRGIKDQMGDMAKQAGVDMKFDDKIWENTVNNLSLIHI